MAVAPAITTARPIPQDNSAISTTIPPLTRIDVGLTIPSGPAGVVVNSDAPSAVFSAS